MKSNFVGLIILDGFGLNKNSYGNAIAQANPQNFYNYLNTYPSTSIEASGEDVGLPAGQMGNSEVGHLNIGAGRIVYQVSQKISNDIKTKDFFKNKEILSAMQFAKNNGSSLHLMGLLSDGGVHSNIYHLFALLDMAQQNDVKNVYIHCFTDGRDTYRDSGVKYVKMLQEKLAELKSKGYDYKIASVMGRFYVMDREQNWDKTEIAYKTLVFGEGDAYCDDPIFALEDSYKNGIYDEFVKPVVIINGDSPVATIKDNDAVIFYNFREDRARQITQALIEKFDKFSVVNFKNLYFVGFNNYNREFKNLHVAFEEKEVEMNLSHVLSNAGIKQFKISETTKYAHVTYFLNGGIEKPYPGEERFLIETIKNVPFDEVPQMRAVEITDKAIEEIKTKKYGFMALNYSNCDMIGHTGNLQAAIEAVKVLDVQLKRLVDAILSIDGTAVIIADHGNAECMLDKEGRVLTDHTTNKVPFIIVGNENKKLNLLQNGKLSNVAPTILDLLGMAQPADFQESSMIIK